MTAKLLLLASLSSAASAVNPNAYTSAWSSNDGWGWGWGWAWGTHATSSGGGPSSLATNSASTCPAPTTTAYSSFTYTQVTSTRYATAIPSPLKYTAYAPAFAVASTLLPTSLTYTTYSYSPSATPPSDAGPYGPSAYMALWNGTTYSNTHLPYTTTVSPTPVASSELIFPPPLYSACPSADACLDCYKLPSDFIMGVAGSAWQIEGALQSEGRGPSALDGIGLGPYQPGTNDSYITDLNYYLYKVDIARLAAIGIKYYSFSIAWSRILPFGVAGSPINQQGIDHYDDLINTCIAYGITPIATLVHFDYPASLPVPLTSGPELDAWRADYLFYAKLVMARYGDRVPYWVTFNEPNGIRGSPPNFNAWTSVLLAHSDVYKWYKETLKGTGQITIKFSNNLALPRNSSSPDDVEAAFRYQDFLLSMGNPLYLGEQYSRRVLDTPGILLTPLTTDQIAYINGSVDFYSLDPYTAQFAEAPAEGLASCITNTTDPNHPICATLTNVQSDGWYDGDKSNDYAYIDPQYVRQQVGYIWNTYKPSGILISEFGFNPFADSERTLTQQRFDLERTLYYQEFLRELLKAKWEDGVNVIGTLAWSFVDNCEFGSYSNMYGLQAVNRTDGHLTRTYKRSIFDYVDFFSKYMEL